MHLKKKRESDFYRKAMKQTPVKHWNVTAKIIEKSVQNLVYDLFVSFL